MSPVRCPKCHGKGFSEGPQWNQTDTCERCKGSGVAEDSAAPATEPSHRHQFVNDGLRYAHSDYPMPGSGAYRRSYYRLYFCPECMERRAERLEHTDDSYGKVQFGAEPASQAEKAVMR